MGSGAGNLTAIAGRQRWVHGREAEPIRYETGDGQLDLQGMGNRFKCEEITSCFFCFCFFRFLFLLNKGRNTQKNRNFATNEVQQAEYW